MDRDQERQFAEFALRACINWQESRYTKPMTCRSPKHRLKVVTNDKGVIQESPTLEPKMVEHEGDEYVALVCPECLGIQVDIPPVVIEVQAHIDNANTDYKRNVAGGFPAEMIRLMAMPRFLAGGQ